jgi:hypothetical protein
MKPGLKYDGKDFTLGAGSVICFYEKESLITIMAEAGTGKRVIWNNEDDKYYSSPFVKNEKDFFNLVLFLAEIIGCQIESYDWPYGPAYLFT